VQNDAVIRKPATLIILALLAMTCREKARPLNVLLITVDTFRADRVGRNTPTLSRLAGEGVRFDAADSPVPLTLPAHASLMSGLLPLHHGLRNNGVGAFPAARQTLAAAFAKSYRTGAFVGSFILDHRFGLDRGFERYDDEIVRNGTDSSGTFDAERRGGEVVDRALDWLRQNDARPFFAWVHLYDAHAPYAPPPPYPQTYDGEVAYVDAQVARLLAAVDRGNTIIVVVGDHGEALGEHGELTHGLLLYEPTLHVPMIIAAPSLAARVIKTPVSTVDLAPTIAALAGVAFAPADGRNLAGDLRNDREPQSAPIYAETQYPATFGWSELSSMRLSSSKLISAPAPELYDLQRDPAEVVNVLTNERRTYRDLATRLDQLRSTAVASSPSTIDAETRAKLASLGYVAPAQTTGGTKRDPKTVAPLFRAFEEATAMLNAGRARDAAASLEQLVQDDPANHVFRETLARALRQSGDVPRAIELYRQAVALAPNDADAWYNLAAALQESGNAREGATALAEAAKRDPNRPEIHNIRGTALAEAGNLGDAEKEFRATIAADPRNARAYNNLGNVLSAMNRPSEAADAYQKSIELAPRYADPLNGLGAMLVSGGHARDALPYFDRAMQIAPDYYEAQLNRAVALQMSGDSAAAAAEVQRLLARLPEGRQYDSERSTARAFLGRLPPQFRR
jgi:arylsulfatase A-like enzyme/Tfp pilus assembly protein PilF